MHEVYYVSQEDLALALGLVMAFADNHQFQEQEMELAGLSEAEANGVAMLANKLQLKYGTHFPGEAELLQDVIAAKPGFDEEPFTGN